jgi:hypothetical protein
MQHDDERRNSSPLRAIFQVLCAFVGIRRSSAADVASIKPVHLIIAAIIAAAVFVVTIVTLVNLIV